MKRIKNSLKKIGFLILSTLLFFSCQDKWDKQDSFSSLERAKLHPLIIDRPAPDFFEGALMGNGGLGVVLTTRPDGIVLYFGHNNVWDIRIAENNKEKIGTFDYVFRKVKSIPDTLSVLTQDPWFREYSEITAENYSKPYPRPFPCGSVLLGFDRRNAELIGHKLDISNGLCEVTLLTRDQKKLRLQVFTDQNSDKLWMRLIDSQGNPCPNIFDRMRILPDPSTPDEFPKFKADEDLPHGVLSFRQVLPYEEPGRYNSKKGHPKDRAFRLTAASNSSLEKKSRINWDGNKEDMVLLEGSFIKKEGFVGCISLKEGLNLKVENELQAEEPTAGKFEESLERSIQIWKDYWNKSGVKLNDELLETTWYHNLYFFNCAVKEGVNTPGLFANWSYNSIGTAWHGDYHMNYNTEQPFWLCFSSNHLEKNLSYVSLIEFLMNVSRKWARSYYNLPGAYFPHSAYPVDMTINSYPVPSWGWEICETPWAVQGLWWHYLYSQDKEYLKNRAYGPIREAVEFVTAYMKRPEAHGPQWKDDKYHIFPTIPPELYALRPGFKYNYDCTVDLTLVKFLFKAFKEAARVLGREKEDETLLSDVNNILTHFPDYATAESKKYGRVYVSVPGEHDQVVYNVPNALITVFPGEDHGLHSKKETLDILKNTFLNQQNEGGNDLVFMNMQAVRLGLLDLEKFKRQINYCLLPNGTATDMAMQVHGRYEDLTDYGFMDNMGIWFENFALPAVIDECLMQSYDGTIRLFPNWPLEKDAEFHNLRAAGAFLVSTKLKNGKVKGIEIFSEAGTPLKIMLPWKKGGIMKNHKGKSSLKSNYIEMETEKGEKIIFKP
jgi:alpha-L-fucosidase 2